MFRKVFGHFAGPSIRRTEEPCSRLEAGRSGTMHMSVTADEILRAACARVAPLTGETAGYFVLGVADCVGARGGRITPAALVLTEDGSVRAGPVEPGSSADTEAALRSLLEQLLACVPPGVPALVRVSRAAPDRGIAHLVSELEAALIPVNRAAARRALARLCRDVMRAKASGKILDAQPPLPVPVPPVAVQSRAAAPSTPQAPEAQSGPGNTPVVPRTELEESPSTRVVTPVVSRAEAPEAPPSAPVAVAKAAVRGFDDEGVLEPEKTPFLGAWPGAAPVRTAFRGVVWQAPAGDEHDTEDAPPVALDDDVDFDVDVEVEPAAPLFIPEPPLLTPFAPPAAPSVAAATADEEPPAPESSERVPWAEAEESMTAAPLAFGGVAEEERVTPVAAQSRSHALFAALEPDEYTAPWPPLAKANVEPAPEETSDESDDDAPAPSLATFFDVDGDGMDEGPPSEEFASASLQPDIGIDVAQLLFDDEFRARQDEEAANAALEPLVRAADDAFVDAAGEKEAAVTAASEREAFFLDSAEEPEKDVAPEPEESLPEDEAALPPPVEARDVPPSTFVPAKVPIASYRPRQSDVRTLLEGFADDGGASLNDVSRELQRFAGIGGTPDPGAVSISPPRPTRKKTTSQR